MTVRITISGLKNIANLTIKISKTKVPTPLKPIPTIPVKFVFGKMPFAQTEQKWMDEKSFELARK